jgi:hypothetical protein
MALTISNLTTATGATSTTTKTISSVTANPGDMLVVVVAADNNGSSGAASLQSTMTDSAGNVYTNRVLYNHDPGAAAAGSTLGIWTADIAKAISAGTITVNFSPATTRMAAVVYRVVPGTYEKVNYGSAGAGAVSTGTTNTITATNVPIGYTIFGCTSVENTIVPATPDTDTTNGSWSTQYGVASSSGTAASSMSVGSQWKTVTATGNQTYNLTYDGANNRDSAVNWITIYPRSLEYWNKNGIVTA